MVIRKLTLIATLTAVTAAAAACTAAKGVAAAGPSAVNPAFAHRLDRLCAADYAAMASTSKKPLPYQDFNPEHPRPGELPGVGRFFAPNVAVWQRLPGQLTALGEPATGAAAWDRLRTLEAQKDANGIRQVHAALAGDISGFVATARTSKALFSKLTDAEHAAGIPDGSPCMDAF
jgi:hypothetical protein